MHVVHTCPDYRALHSREVNACCFLGHMKASWCTGSRNVQWLKGASHTIGRWRLSARCVKGRAHVLSQRVHLGREVGRVQAAPACLAAVIEDSVVDRHTGKSTRHALVNVTGWPVPARLGCGRFRDANGQVQGVIKVSDVQGGRCARSHTQHNAARRGRASGACWYGTVHSTEDVCEPAATQDHDVTTLHVVTTHLRAPSRSSRPWAARRGPAPPAAAPCMHRYRRWH